MHMMNVAQACMWTRVWRIHMMSVVHACDKCGACMWTVVHAYEECAWHMHHTHHMHAPHSSYAHAPHTICMLAPHSSHACTTLIICIHHTPHALLLPHMHAPQSTCGALKISGGDVPMMCVPP